MEKLEGKKKKVNTKNQYFIYSYDPMNIDFGQKQDSR